ncbi:MAG: hypothetical protein HY898_01180 [Deltaproteobacteria bacterium]|nr:hypothetical protein [Deltaproteobacteria bacterium]
MAQPDTARSGRWDDDAEVTDECRGRYTLPNLGGASAELGRGGIGRVLIVRDHHLGRDLVLGDGSAARLMPVDLSISGQQAGQLQRDAERETGMKLDGFSLTLAE